MDAIWLGVQPAVSGGGGGGGTSIDRRFMVAKSGGSHTDVPAAIASAMALVPPPSVSDPVLIEVYAGAFLTAPFTLKTGIQLVAPGGIQDVILVATVTTSPLVTLEPNSMIKGFTLTGANGVGGKGIESSGAIGIRVIQDVFIKDCTLGFDAIGAGVITHISNLGFQRFPTETMNMGVYVRSGATVISSQIGIFGVPGTSIAVGIKCEGSGSSFNGANIYVNYADNALFVDDNGDLRVHTSEIANATIYATRIGLLGNSFLELTGVHIDPDATWDLYVESATAQIRLSSPNMRANNIMLPAALPVKNILGMFTNEDARDPGLQILSELAVGMHDRGAESCLGEGDSHVRGMKVFTNTNGEIGTWADESVPASSPTGSPFTLFPGVGVDNCCYFGGDLVFPGLKTQVIAAFVEGAGTLVWEFWNGAAWTSFYVLATDADAPYGQYAQNVFKRAAQSDQIRFGNGMGTWAKKTLSSENKYWVRCRIATAITTSPTLEMVKLHTNRTEINKDGYVEHFGNAEPERDLALVRSKIFGSAPGDKTVEFSANIDFVGDGNNFANATTDATGAGFHAPDGVDTSKELTLEVKWCNVGNAGGDVELQFRYTTKKVGEAMDGAGVETYIAKIITVPINTPDGIFSTTFDIVVPDLAPGDMLACSVTRDATGGNDPPDTLIAAIYLVSFRIYGKFWK